MLTLQITEVHEDSHKGSKGLLIAWSCTADLLPLDLSKTLINFWTIKILVPRKKHLLQLSVTNSSLVSVSSLICAAHLVLVFQRGASLLTQLSSNDPSGEAENSRNRGLRHVVLACSPVLQTVAERPEQS